MAENKIIPEAGADVKADLVERFEEIIKEVNAFIDQTVKANNEQLEACKKEKAEREAALAAVEEAKEKAVASGSEKAYTAAEKNKAFNEKRIDFLEERITDLSSDQIISREVYLEKKKQIQDAYYDIYGQVRKEAADLFRQGLELIEFTVPYGRMANDALIDLYEKLYTDYGDPKNENLYPIGHTSMQVIIKCSTKSVIERARSLMPRQEEAENSAFDQVLRKRSEEIQEKNWKKFKEEHKVVEHDPETAPVEYV